MSVGRGCVLTLAALLMFAALGASPALAAKPKPRAKPKSPAAQGPTRLDATGLLAKVGAAIVTVVAHPEEGDEESQGSGFIIDQSGLIVTTLHVVAGWDHALVKLRNGAFYPVDGLVAWDENLDYALLKVSGSDLPVVRLGRSASLKPGSHVLLLSSPQGLEHTAAEGIVSAVREVGRRGRLLQVTAPMSPGSSGGAVFTETGEVIGVACSQFVNGQNLNFAVPIDLIKPGLAARREPTDLADLTAAGIGMSAAALVEAGTKLEPTSEDEGEVCTAKAQKALALHQKAIAKDPTYVPAYKRAGACMTFLKKHEEALKYDQQALELAPDDAEVHYDLGVDYRDLARWEEAAKELEQAVKLDPKPASYHADLGRVYDELGRFAEAMEEYQAAVAAEPEDAQYHASLGASYGDAKRFDEALPEFQEACKLSPRDVWLQLNVVDCLQQMGRREEMAAACRRAATLAEDDVLARWITAEYYRKAEFRKEALALAEDMTKGGDGADFGYYEIGLVHLDLREYDEAIRNFRKALEIDKDMTIAYAGLGDCYRMQGRYKDAIEMYQLIIKESPDSVPGHLGLGLTYVLTGDHAKGLEEYQVLKEKDEAAAAQLFEALYPPTQKK